MGHVVAGPGRRGIPTFALLDQLVTVLGSTKLSFWPFLSASGEACLPYGASTDGIVLTAATALNAAGAGGHDPAPHIGGIYSYQVDGTADADRLQSADNANYSFGDGAIDSAFSVGCWVLMQEALGTARTMMAKYRTTAASQREWVFHLSTTGQITLEVHDESVPANWQGLSLTNTIAPWVWQFCVATYAATVTAGAPDVYGTTSDIVTYLNAVAETPVSVKTGVYVAMENGTSTLTVGSNDQGGAAPAGVFQGRIALPFVTGKLLTGANVTTIYSIGKKLLGLSN